MKKLLLLSTMMILGFLVGCTTTTTTTTTVSTTQQNHTLSYYEVNDQFSFGSFVLSEDDTVTQIELGDAHGLAVLNDNRLLSWGNNDRGQLGNDTIISSSIPIEITAFLDLDESETISNIAVGDYHSLVLTSNHRLLIWGWNLYGQLGDGTATQKTVPTDLTDEFDLSINENIIKIVAGSDYSGVVTSEGRVFVWGRNQMGQLGNGTINDTQIPIEITSQFDLNQDELITDLIFGTYHSMALTNEGRLFSWGGNAYGQLGDGTNNLTVEPTDITLNLQLVSGETIQKVSLGDYYSMLLTNQGKLLTWGSNEWGQLGNNSEAAFSWIFLNITSEFNLDTEETITDVVAGPTYAMASTSLNRVFTWGKNNRGQLGDGSTSNQIVPIEILTDDFVHETNDVIYLSTGIDFSMIILQSGDVFGWGNNNDHQLTFVEEMTKAEPVAIAFEDEVMNLLKEETYVFQASIEEYVPTKSGFTFSGWYTDIATTTPFTSTTMPNQAISLYGRWIPDSN